MIVDEEGILEVFFLVYASEKMKADVLSFTDVEDLYNITYIQKRAFIVHMGVSITGRSSTSTHRWERVEHTCNTAGRHGESVQDLWATPRVRERKDGKEDSGAIPGGPYAAIRR